MVFQMMLRSPMPYSPGRPYKVPSFAFLILGALIILADSSSASGSDSGSGSPQPQMNLRMPLKNLFVV